MNDTVGAGDFIFWEAGCALIGKATNITPKHAHYAIQIGVGAELGIRFRSDAVSPWTEYAGALIPSRQPHMMDATQVTCSAVIFIEPETPAGRVLAEKCLGSGIASLDSEPFTAAASRLLETWQRHGSATATTTAAQQVIDTLTDGARGTIVSDERIIRAVAYIRNHLDAPLSLEDVAREACLSPSRFRHLFVEQTGTALRPYVLWRRFLRAWETVIRGDSLSMAAHSAGFADAAHLTRTSHRMFGFPPSALQLNARRDPSSPQMERKA